MDKELKAVLKKINKMMDILENSPDIGDTSMICVPDIRKTNSLLDKLYNQMDALSGDVANLIRMEKEI